MSRYAQTQATVSKKSRPKGIEITNLHFKPGKQNKTKQKGQQQETPKLPDKNETKIPLTVWNQEEG